MSIQSHPLSNVKLGNLVSVNTVNLNEGNPGPAIFITQFWYENGTITLDNNWKWKVAIDAEQDTNWGTIENDPYMPSNTLLKAFLSETEGTMSRASSLDSLGSLDIAPDDSQIAYAIVEMKDGIPTVTPVIAVVNLPQVAVDATDDMSDMSVFDSLSFSPLADIDNSKKDS